MSRVLIIGYGPLPRPGLTYVTSATLRMRQFLKPLLAAGHTINLFTLPLPGTEGAESEIPSMVPDNYEGLAYQRFTSHSGEFAIRALTEQARRLEPDAIVGINTYPAYIGAMLATTIPFWADLNGSWMAEMAGRCWAERDDSRLADAWAIERVILRRADKYSAVSRPQLHATLGELFAVGRVNQHTFAYQFGHRIPNAGFRWPGGDAEPDAMSEPVLRGPLVPADAFVVLWSGGFNPWADIPTLIAAINRLMEHYPLVHFVSTGGRIEGSSQGSYHRFQEMVDDSPYKDRYHLMGWVDCAMLPRIYREADVGINVDGANYETMLGGRNRINAMASEGLAVASSLGSEITEWLEDGRAILSAPMGDPIALADTIEPWIEQREHLSVYARNAVEIMNEDFNYDVTTRALQNWLQRPALAPDNEAKLAKTGESVADLKSIVLNPLEEEALLLMRYPARDLKAAWDEYAQQQASAKRGMFGLRRSRD